MSINTFINESGLKVLAMARLDHIEYSIMLYLMNCTVSGLDELITTEKELSSLIGYDEDPVHHALSALSKRNFINLSCTDAKSRKGKNKSLRLGFQFDITRWEMDFDKDVNHRDAIVFPFQREKNLQLVADSGEKLKSNATHISKALPTWQRVVESYSKGRDLDSAAKARSIEEAKMMIQTYPVDQILLMLRHFAQRIPTISLLASSWQHYQELFTIETQKVDLLGAKQKHDEKDAKLRRAVQETLKQIEDLNLSEEEISVLKVISEHSHPRRQLFWAYQTRGRYPNLKKFFKENSVCMLPVTTSGTIVKKKPHRDS